MNRPKRPLGVTIVAVITGFVAVGGAVNLFLTMWYYLTNPEAPQAEVTIYTFVGVGINLIMTLIMFPAGLGLWQMKSSGITLAMIGWGISLMLPIITLFIVLMTGPTRSWNCSVDIVSIIILVYLSSLRNRSEFTQKQKRKIGEVLPAMEDDIG